MQKKLIYQFLFVMFILNSTYINAINTKTTGNYFYSSSYEGFAGYCAVITEELADVSHKMKKSLNISEAPSKSSFFTSSDFIPAVVTQVEANNSSRTNFSQQVESVNNANLSNNSILPSSKLNFSTVVTSLNNEKNI